MMLNIKIGTLCYLRFSTSNSDKGQVCTSGGIIGFEEIDMFPYIIWAFCPRKKVTALNQVRVLPQFIKLKKT